MRVAIVSDYFPEYVGGAQTSMRQQQLALQAAGHHAVLVAAVKSGPRLQRRADGLRVRPSFTLPGVQLPVIHNSASTRAALRSYFEDERIEVVHVQSEFGLVHAAADVAAEMGLPVVHTVHTFYWASEGGWHAPLAPLIRWRVARSIGREIPRRGLSPRPVDNVLRNLTLAMALRADVVVSPSAHQARDLEAAGVASGVRVIPNPIAVSPAPSEPLTVADATPPRLLWVARCDAVKRPLVFARGAMDALARVPGGFSVDFVGDGAELPALRRSVEEHPELRVHGALPHDRVLELMDESSAVVLSSLGFDNQPMTIAEAVSRQRGVLYCDPKLEEGLARAGYVTSNPDESGFAEALVALAQDPSQLVRMSEGAAADASEFAPETYVSRFQAVVEQ